MMKRYFLVTALMLSAVISAQNKKPVHTIEGSLVKSTYFYDNGQVSQEGYYKDGKVHGKWTAYDENGNKKSMATYDKGVKTGKWIFWQETSVREVDYSDNRIVAVRNLNNDAVVTTN